jgi:hypothetical protein
MGTQVLAGAGFSVYTQTLALALPASIFIMENLSKGKLALIALGIWIAFSFGGGTMAAIGFWAGLIFFVYGLRKSSGKSKKALSDEKQKEDARALVDKMKGTPFFAHPF